MYKLSNEDAPWSLRFDGCFNLLTGFAQELNWAGKDKTERPASLTAWNNIFVNGCYTDGDVLTLVDYAHEVAQRAEDKYMSTMLSEAPWREAVLQAVTRLRDVTAQFLEWHINLRQTLIRQVNVELDQARGHLLQRQLDIEKRKCQAV